MFRLTTKALRNGLLLFPFLFLPQARQDSWKEAVLALIGRNYDQAIAKMEEAIKAVPPGEGAEAKVDQRRFLRANALLAAGRFGQAREAFEKLAAERPKGSYAALSRFGKAAALEMSRNFEVAARIYREEMKRLLDPARRMEFAGIYLRFAEEALAKLPRDWETGVQFLDLALGLGLPEAKARELQARAAKLCFEQKSYTEAWNRYKALVKRIQGVEGPKSAKAERLMLARAIRLAKRPSLAKPILEDLLRENAEPRKDLVYELAKCFEGMRSWNRADEELIRFVEEAPGDPRAPGALLGAARSRAAAGRLEEALAALTQLNQKFGDRMEKVAADAAAERAKWLAKLGRYDQGIQAWKEFLSRYPSHPSWRAGQRAILDLEYAKGLAARKAGKAHYDEAKQLFLDFMKRHPLDQRNPGTALLLGKMEEERKAYDEAMRLFEECASRYKGSREASEAAYRRAMILETIRFQPALAAAAYQKVRGAFASLARRRIRELVKESFKVETKRAFRTDEKPEIVVTTKNIKKLRVRVYGLDWEGFFRGSGSSMGVGELAIEAIAPLRSFEYVVKEFKPYTEFVNKIPMPAGKAGTWLVKVDDGKREATTLVLVTDLVLIRKALAKEVFVFAMDAKKQQPVPGVRVLFSDGTKVVAEKLTGARGACRYAYPEGGAAKRGLLRVPSLPEGPPRGGVEVLGLSPLGVAVGESAALPWGESGRTFVPKTALFTDRPAYRAGEWIGAQAVLRDVRAGRYVPPPAGAYHFVLQDPLGRVIARSEVKSNEFGSVHTRFWIPGNPRVGSWSVSLRRKKDGALMATTRVAVLDFKPPAISLSLELEHKTITRGEPIEGRVQARYFFGGPVKNRKIQVQFSAGKRSRILEGKTNGAGEFAFDFATDEIQGSPRLEVWAFLPEEGARATVEVRMRELGFALGLKIPLGVYLAGESVEAEVEAKTHEGKPLGKKIELTLLRREVVRGKVRTIVLARKDLVTGAKTGKAFGNFVVGEGGDYRLVAAGTDRNGHRVETQKDFFVSGKKDKVKLRLLSTKQHARVGEEVGLRVVNRVGPKLCLFTSEAEGILRFESRVLPAGVSKISLKMEALHAPNFAYAITMVDGNKLHTTSKSFTVSVPMRIEVRLARKVYRPGEKVEVELLVKDSAGRPVEAEFSLAAVDAAVLQRFTDRSPNLYEQFFGRKVRRSTKVVTSSSCSFSFVPQVKDVDPNLRLEEAEKKTKAVPKWGVVGAEGLGRAPLTGGPQYKGPGDFLLGREEGEEVNPDMFNDVVGVGGGAAGKFGGRHGGRRSLGGVFGTKDRPSGFFYDDGLDVSFLGALVTKDGKGLDALLERNLRQEEGDLVRPNDLSVWRTRIRSDKNGVARFDLSLPERTGKWVLRVRGMDRGSLFGDQKAEVLTRNPLVVRGRVPMHLTEGDKVQAEIEAHNLDTKAYTGELVQTLDTKVVAREPLSLQAGERLSRSLSLPASKPGMHSFVFAASGSADRGYYRVHPWALRDEVGDGGLLAQVRKVRLSLRGGTHLNRVLQIHVYPPSADTLAKTYIALAEGQRRVLAQERVSLGLGALALYRELGAFSGRADLLLRSLRGLAERTLGALAGTEVKGEICWVSAKRPWGDPYPLLLSWLFLERAAQAGIPVDTALKLRVRRRGLAWIQRGKNEAATLAFLASVVGRKMGKEDFSYFNQLRRRRSQMRVGALGKLVLAALEMRRPGLALGLKSLLEERLRDAMMAPPGNPSFPPRAGLLWGLLALQRLGGERGILEKGESFAFRNLSAFGWRDPLPMALAAEFLALRRKSMGNVAAEVDLKVGSWSAHVNFRERPQGMVFVLREKDLPKGRVDLQLRSSGMGKVAWGARLVGWTEGLTDARIGAPELRRAYLQTPPLIGGSPVKEGFRTVRLDEEFKAWDNPSDRVETGRALLGRVQVRLLPSQAESMPYFIVEEPLPGGVAVREGDISGDFDFVEKRDGSLRFYCSTRGRRKFTFRFKMRGVLPGSFRVLPTRLRPLSDKGEVLFGQPSSLLVVDDPKAAEVSRKPTPDELYFSGIEAFDHAGLAALKADAPLLARVEAPLEDCMRSFGKHLRPGPFFELGKRLLAVRLIRGKGRPILELFEKLKEVRPDFALSFEDMARVGQAYFEAGEFERSLYVYQAVSESLFLREVQVAGTLKEKARVQDALGVMARLFGEYPGLPEIRSAMFSLAQGMSAYAQEQKRAPHKDPAFGSRDQLLRQARNLCYEYLLRYPADGDADEVCYTLVNIAIEGKQWDEALTLLRSAIGAYGQSPWLDDFLFLNGYALFLKKDFDGARKVLSRLVDEDFVLGGGKKGKSPGRALALFLQAQCEHARGNIGEAVALYHKVARQFTEAQEALAFFEGKKLKLPEVTMLPPGTPASIKLATRNLERVHLLVYKVDLMRLYLLRRSLADLGRVKLLGIPATQSFNVELKGATPFRDHEQQVSLKLGDEGAYLILVQAGSLKSSGLLLRSDLKIDAQEYPSESRLRLNVKKKGRALPSARVKIVRSGSSQVLSGTTDLRGVFVGDGLRGGVTALVECDGQYAFYRSPLAYGPSRQAKGRPFRGHGNRPRQQKTDLLRNNSIELRKLQERGGQSLERLFKNSQRGVELKRTK